MDQIWSARVVELNENLRHVLELYMNWYTFYWTMNLATLAWIYAKTATTGDHTTHVQRMIAGVFFVMTLAGSCTCFVAIGMTRSMLHAIADAKHQWVAATQPGATTQPVVADAFPANFAFYGLTVNGLGLFALALVWLYLARRRNS